MNSKKRIKSCLLVSYGPVPTPQYQKIEGGGMRVWGLAKGLQANGVSVTIAVNNAFPQKLKQVDGVKLVNWSPDDAFVQLLNSHDSILVSYSMGSDAVFIVDNLKDEITLILDAYVPIFIEVSARGAHNMKSELKNYQADLTRWNHVLKRGDYFICASESQKTFYIGVLGSLGVLNPRSYNDNRILIVPFGIHDTPMKAVRNPYLDLGITKQNKIILWFGGLYPWFKVEDYLEAIKHLTKKDKMIKFVFVGGKNPFNDNPDFLKKYNDAIEFTKKHSLYNKSVFFVDWVDFDSRGNWYKHADFVISLNNSGDENAFAWRTRVMDYVWGEVVTITNGGDPLGDMLINHEAAIKLNTLSATDIQKTISRCYTDKNILKNTLKNLKNLKPTFFWNEITKELATVIANESHPYVNELNFRNQNEISSIFDGMTEISIPITPRHGPRHKIKKAATLPIKLYSHAKQKGFKKSAKLVADIARNRLSKDTVLKTRKYLFLSNPIDNSGAPMVMLDIIKEISDKFGKKNIRVMTPAYSSSQKRLLRSRGINIEKSAQLNPRLTGVQLNLNYDDFVLLNTVAIYDNYRNYIFNLLNANRLKKAYWFIHEDLEQLKVVAPGIMEQENIDKISKLIANKKLYILVPSLRVKRDYDKLFGVKSVVSVPLHVDTGTLKPAIRKKEDFSTLRFFMSGISSDGRKGQLIIIAAFQKFIDLYYIKNPNKYRAFEVHFVAILDDYVSSQVKSIGSSVLGDRFKTYPVLPRPKALRIASKCNVVVCASLNETFGLFVAESMLMESIVLRNNAAGIDEQLSEGENGFYIDSDDISQFASILEQLLNKDKMSNSDLHKLGKKSKKIAEVFSNNKYLNFIEAKNE